MLPVGFGSVSAHWRGATRMTPPSKSRARTRTRSPLETVGVLRSVADLNEPGDLRLSASGPASSIAVLAYGGFMSGDRSDSARKAALHARMSADIDVEGDPIEAAARAVGDRVFAETRSGSIAAIVSAGELARLRSWVDPFSETPKSGYLVGGGPPKDTDK